MHEGYSRWYLATLIAYHIMLSNFGSALFAAPTRPNVLLILSDDHSFPHISCYGDKNITRFRLSLIHI